VVVVKADPTALAVDLDLAPLLVLLVALLGRLRKRELVALLRNGDSGTGVILLHRRLLSVVTMSTDFVFTITHRGDP